MGNVSNDPELPPSHPEAAEASGMPPEHWGPRYSDEDIQERHARPAPKRDSYVSNVVNPDDRRFIPRR